MMNKKSALQMIALSSLSLGVFAANHPQEQQNGAFDLAVADEHKLIEMLKKSGKISADASLNDAENALRGFLKERQDIERKKAKPLDLETAAKLHKNSAKSLTQSLTSGKGNKLGQAKKNRPAPLHPVVKLPV